MTKKYNGYYLTMDAPHTYYCSNLERVYRETMNALIDDVVVKAYKDEVEQERHKKLYKNVFDI